MPWYTNSNGSAYMGDRQTRPDGTPDPQISDRPSPQYAWNGTAWVLQPQPDWTALVNVLRQSAPMARVIKAANTTTSAGTAFTLLYGVLVATHDLNTLTQDIKQMRIEMAKILTVGDFSSDEIAWLNQQLANCGFNLRLS